MYVLERAGQRWLVVCSCGIIKYLLVMTIGRGRRVVKVLLEGN